MSDGESLYLVIESEAETDEEEFSDYSSSMSDDAESFSGVESDLDRMHEVMMALHNSIATLESQMEGMHRPLESLHLDQLGDLPFLSTSPFRHETFLIRPPGIPGLNVDKRVPFHVICETLRNHFFETGAVQPDGSITLSADMQKLFGIQERTATFFDIMLRLRRVLI